MRFLCAKHFENSIALGRCSIGAVLNSRDPHQKLPLIPSDGKNGIPGRLVEPR